MSWERGPGRISETWEELGLDSFSAEFLLLTPGSCLLVFKSAICNLSSVLFPRLARLASYPMLYALCSMLRQLGPTTD